MLLKRINHLCAMGSSHLAGAFLLEFQISNPDDAIAPSGGN